jgi:hypothetical protein
MGVSSPENRAFERWEFPHLKIVPLRMGVSSPENRAFERWEILHLKIVPLITYCGKIL